MNTTRDVYHDTEILAVDPEPPPDSRQRRGTWLLTPGGERVFVPLDEEPTE